MYFEPGQDISLYGASNTNPVGTSDFSTWLADPQPAPNLEIQTPSFYGMINTEGIIPTSPTSVSYINSRSEKLGGIVNLNNSEMLFLLDKHFGD